MNAEELIHQAGLPPDELTLVEAAFEAAWFQVEPQLGSEASPERARIRLASIILLLTRIIEHDPERLKIAALKVFDPDLGKHFERSDAGPVAGHEDRGQGGS
jgi:hypothetical protein